MRVLYSHLLTEAGLDLLTEAGDALDLALIGYAWQYNVAFAVLFLAGSSLGWGQPVGWLISGKKSGNYEVWQLGFLKDSPHLAVLVRGLLWALPTAPLLYFDQRVLGFLIVMPLAFYGAALASHYTVRAQLRYAWEAHEVLRGALLAAGLLTWNALR